MLNNVISILSGAAAAAGDYESIAIQSVGAGGTASVTFSSIPATYKHLQIRGIGRGLAASTIIGARVRFNSDTGNNYARHVLTGDGASATAAAAASGNVMGAFAIPAATANASVFGAGVIDILDYTNTNKYKTLRALGGVDNNGSGELNFYSGLWVNTNAIDTIVLFPSSGNWDQYTTFALYGVKG